MYFWNIGGLLDDIASQKITEQQKLNYYLLMVCASLVVTTLVLTIQWMSRPVSFPIVH